MGCGFSDDTGVHHTGHHGESDSHRCQDADALDALGPNSSDPFWAETAGGSQSANSSKLLTAGSIDLCKVMRLTPRKFHRASAEDVEALRVERAHRVDWAVQGLMARKKATYLHAAHSSRHQTKFRGGAGHCAPAALRPRHSGSQPRHVNRRLLPPSLTQHQEGDDLVSNSDASHVLDTWRGNGDEPAFELLTTAPGTVTPTAASTSARGRPRQLSTTAHFKPGDIENAADACDPSGQTNPLRVTFEC